MFARPARPVAGGAETRHVAVADQLADHHVERPEVAKLELLAIELLILLDVAVAAHSDPAAGVDLGDAEGHQLAAISGFSRAVRIRPV